MREWQDVSIKVSFKLPSADAAACIGSRSVCVSLCLSVSEPLCACIGSRVDQMWNDGIVLCVDGAGRYNLTGLSVCLSLCLSLSLCL